MWNMRLLQIAIEIIILQRSIGLSPNCNLEIFSRRNPSHGPIQHDQAHFQMESAERKDSQDVMKCVK